MPAPGESRALPRDLKSNTGDWETDIGSTIAASGAFPQEYKSNVHQTRNARDISVYRDATPAVVLVVVKDGFGSGRSSPPDFGPSSESTGRSLSWLLSKQGLLLLGLVGEGVLSAALFCFDLFSQGEHFVGAAQEFLADPVESLLSRRPHTIPPIVYGFYRRSGGYHSPAGNPWRVAGTPRVKSLKGPV
jgi:hypothetical protein